MPLATRDATVTWTGTPTGGGQGALRTGGGAEQDLPMDWSARSEQAEGTTSPEELLAASLAGCYAMQLSLELRDRDVRPERLEVHATTDLDGEPAEHDYRITVCRLEVEAPDVDREVLDAAMAAADEKCPLVRALAVDVETTVR
jgi:lipoyl-dependent peroxiredoxin